MNLDKEIEHIFDSLRRVLFYAGHGKYNHVMNLEDIHLIQANIEKILVWEESYKRMKSMEEKEALYAQLLPYKTYSIRDFMEFKVERI